MSFEVVLAALSKKPIKITTKPFCYFVKKVSYDQSRSIVAPSGDVTQQFVRSFGSFSIKWQTAKSMRNCRSTKSKLFLYIYCANLLHAKSSSVSRLCGLSTHYFLLWIQLDIGNSLKERRRKIEKLRNASAHQNCIKDNDDEYPERNFSLKLLICAHTKFLLDDNFI